MEVGSYTKTDTSLLSFTGFEESETDIQKGGSYLRVHFKHDYNTALLLCKAMGAHLVEYENQQEIYDVSSTLSLTTEKYWIGLNDITQEGTFVWEHSGQILSYSEAWESGEPYDSNNEDCVLQHNGYWYDVKCDLRNYYICEF